MEKVSLEGEIRKKIGKSSAGRLRRTGYIPAILYGGKEKPQPLIVNTKDLGKALSFAAGENVIISLRVGDKTKTVIVKDLQIDPVKGDLLHVDLCQISLKERLKTAVPIMVRGEAPGVKEGGILQHRLREIEVECLPTDIPESIPIDVSGLGIGDSLHIKDLSVTDGIKILADGKESVVSIVPPTVEKVVLPTPEEVVAEPGVIGEEKEIPPEEAGEVKKKPAPPPAKEEKKPEAEPKAEEKKK